MPVVGLSACGRNDQGQLGDDTTTNRLTVAPIQLPAYPVDVAAGVWHTLVALEDGSVWAWGNNLWGKLGDGTTTNRLSPVQVVGQGGQGFLSGIISVAAAGYSHYAGYSTNGHSLALSADGEVWAWGYNGSGQLGDGTTTTRATPARVVGLANAIAIAAGGGSAAAGASYGLGTSYALTNDGIVFAWGFDGQGQCGQGTTAASRPSPVQVKNLQDVVAIAAGGASVSGSPWQVAGHALALKENGEVWAWGRNNNGQLGDGSTTDRATPVKVLNISDVVAIAAGGSAIDYANFGGHSLALRRDGTVWAWGLNNHGQLGDGTATNQTTPVQVVGLTDVVAIAAGRFHSLARKKDGTIWAWGYNAYGQLGDGTTTDRLTPTQVSGIDGTDLVWKCARTLGDHTVLMHPHPGRLYLGQIDGIRFEQLIGRVLAGNTLGPVPIPVFNFCPQSVSGVKATRLSLPPSDVIEISATRDPFVAEDPVYLPGTFGPGEQIGTVWVRVKPPILVDGQPNQGLKSFQLKATNAQ